MSEYDGLSGFYLLAVVSSATYSDTRTRERTDTLTGPAVYLEAGFSADLGTTVSGHPHRVEPLLLFTTDDETLVDTLNLDAARHKLQISVGNEVPENLFAYCDEVLDEAIGLIDHTHPGRRSDLRLFDLREPARKFSQESEVTVLADADQHSLSEERLRRLRGCLSSSLESSFDSLFASLFHPTPTNDTPQTQSTRISSKTISPKSPIRVFGSPKRTPLNAIRVALRFNSPTKKRWKHRERVGAIISRCTEKRHRRQLIAVFEGWRAATREQTQLSPTTRTRHERRVLRVDRRTTRRDRVVRRARSKSRSRSRSRRKSLKERREEQRARDRLTLLGRARSSTEVGSAVRAIRQLRASASTTALRPTEWGGAPRLRLAPIHGVVVTRTHGLRWRKPPDRAETVRDPALLEIVGHASRLASRPTVV